MREEKRIRDTRIHFNKIHTMKQEQTGGAVIYAEFFSGIYGISLTFL